MGKEDFYYRILTPIENETEMWPMKLGRWVIDAGVQGKMNTFPVANE